MHNGPRMNGPRVMNTRQPKPAFAARPKRWTSNVGAGLFVVRRCMPRCHWQTPTSLLSVTENRTERLYGVGCARPEALRQSVGGDGCLLFVAASCFLAALAPRPLSRMVLATR